MFRNYSKYEVYSDGKIWSYSRKKFLKQITDKDGYQVVNLCDNDGKMKMYKVHRVVWESVTGSQILDGYEINHIDENKENNSISNLELVSHKENVNYGSRNSRAGKSISKANTNNPKRSKAVGAFKDGELVMVFPSANEAGRNGFNQGAVSACCRNSYLREGNNVFKGFVWRYI